VINNSMFLLYFISMMQHDILLYINYSTINISMFCCNFSCILKVGIREYRILSIQDSSDVGCVHHLSNWTAHACTWCLNLITNLAWLFKRKESQVFARVVHPPSLFNTPFGVVWWLQPNLPAIKRMAVSLGDWWVISKGSLMILSWWSCIIVVVFSPGVMNGCTQHWSALTFHLE
jgi:hypothetical protein